MLEHQHQQSVDLDWSRCEGGGALVPAAVLGVLCRGDPSTGA